MPAVVSSTEGSYEDGTSEAEGIRLWSRSSKNDKNCSRISSAVTGGQSRRRGLSGLRRNALYAG
jgi:hypothetical protein